MFRRSRLSFRPNVGGGRAAATPQEAPVSKVSEDPNPKTETPAPSVTETKPSENPPLQTPASGDGNDQNVENTSSSAVQRRKRFSVKPKVLPGRVSALPRTPKSPVKPVLHSAKTPTPVTDKSTTSTEPTQDVLCPKECNTSDEIQANAIISSSPTPDSNLQAQDASKDIPTTEPIKKQSSTCGQTKEVKSQVPPSIPDRESITISEKAKTLVSKTGFTTSPEEFSLSQLLNDRSDLIRLEKARKLRQLLKQEMHKEKNSKKNKTIIKEYTLDPAKMTMRDLIHYLPTSNPMSSSVEESVQENETVLPQSPGRQESPERAKEPEVQPKMFSPRQESTISSSSLSSAAERGGEGEGEGDEEEAEEEAEEEEEALMVPQLKVSEDGSLIIDEESLTVEVQRMKGPNPIQDRDPIFERGSTTTYSSFRKGNYTKPWSTEETDMFFLAISMVGTDFTMICQLFPHRARSEIKNKFKKEERYNSWRIDKAFRERRKLDLEYFTKLLEKILEFQQNKKKLKSLSEKNKSPKKRKRKSKKATSKLSDVEEENEDDLCDSDDEEEGEKENENLCNEKMADSAPKKKRKRKNKSDPSPEPADGKKKNKRKKKNVQDDLSAPEDSEAAVLPEDISNLDQSENTEPPESAKDTKTKRGKALVPLSKGRKTTRAPKSKAVISEEGESTSEEVAEKQIEKSPSPKPPHKGGSDDDSSDQEMTVQPAKPSRYGRVPKPVQPLNYPAREDTPSSASESTSTKTTAAKPKKKPTVKRPARQQPPKESKKPKLITLRASQSECSEEEDEDEDGAGLHLNHDDNSLAAFVPASLCSPRPVVAEVEETMEELDILAHMPDVLGMSENALCPEASCKRLENERGSVEPCEHQLDLLVDVIDFLSENTEASEDENYNEAAQTLLTIGSVAAPPTQSQPSALEPVSNSTVLETSQCTEEEEVPKSSFQLEVLTQSFPEPTENKDISAPVTCDAIEPIQETCSTQETISSQIIPTQSQPSVPEPISNSPVLETTECTEEEELPKSSFQLEVFTQSIPEQTENIDISAPVTCDAIEPIQETCSTQDTVSSQIIPTTNAGKVASPAREVWLPKIKPKPNISRLARTTKVSKNVENEESQQIDNATTSQPQCNVELSSPELVEDQNSGASKENEREKKQKVLNLAIKQTNIMCDVIVTTKAEDNATTSQPKYMAEGQNSGTSNQNETKREEKQEKLHLPNKQPHLDDKKSDTTVNAIVTTNAVSQMQPVESTTMDLEKVSQGSVNEQEAIDISATCNLSKALPEEEKSLDETKEPELKNTQEIDLQTEKAAGDFTLNTEKPIGSSDREIQSNLESTIEHFTAEQEMASLESVSESTKQSTPQRRRRFQKVKPNLVSSPRVTKPKEVKESSQIQPEKSSSVDETSGQQTLKETKTDEAEKERSVNEDTKMASAKLSVSSFESFPQDKMTNELATLSSGLVANSTAFKPSSVDETSGQQTLKESKTDEAEKERSVNEDTKMASAKLAVSSFESFPQDKMTNKPETLPSSLVADPTAFKSSLQQSVNEIEQLSVSVEEPKISDINTIGEQSATNQASASSECASSGVSESSENVCQGFETSNQQPLSRLTQDSTLKMTVSDICPDSEASPTLPTSCEFSTDHQKPLEGAIEAPKALPQNDSEPVSHLDQAQNSSLQGTTMTSETTFEYPSLIFPDMLSDQVPSDPDEPFFILSLTEIPVCPSSGEVDCATDSGAQQSSPVVVSSGIDDSLSQIHIPTPEKAALNTGLVSVEEYLPNTPAVDISILVEPQGNVDVGNARQNLIKKMAAEETLKPSQEPPPVTAQTEVSKNMEKMEENIQESDRTLDTGKTKRKTAEKTGNKIQNRKTKSSSDPSSSDKPSLAAADEEASSSSLHKAPSTSCMFQIPNFRQQETKGTRGRGKAARSKKSSSETKAISPQSQVSTAELQSPEAEPEAHLSSQTPAEPPVSCQSDSVRISDEEPTNVSQYFFSDVFTEVESEGNVAAEEMKKDSACDDKTQSPAAVNNQNRKTTADKQPDANKEAPTSELSLTPSTSSSTAPSEDPTPPETKPTRGKGRARKIKDTDESKPKISQRKSRAASKSESVSLDGLKDTSPPPPSTTEPSQTHVDNQQCTSQTTRETPESSHIIGCSISEDEPTNVSQSFISDIFTEVESDGHTTTLKKPTAKTRGKQKQDRKTKASADPPSGPKTSQTDTQESPLVVDTVSLSLGEISKPSCSIEEHADPNQQETKGARGRGRASRNKKPSSETKVLPSQRQSRAALKSPTAEASLPSITEPSQSHVANQQSTSQNTSEPPACLDSMRTSFSDDEPTNVSQYFLTDIFTEVEDAL